MIKSKFIFSILIAILLLPQSAFAGFKFQSGKMVRADISVNESEMVKTAFGMLQNDFLRVFDAEIQQNSKQAKLFIGTVGLQSKAENYADKGELGLLKQKREGFLIFVKGNSLIVLGSDKRGTAYGLLELSRMMGVSPWEWWADSPVEKRKELDFPDHFRVMQSPSVKHRGIFINDEDWGLMPWSSQNFEPSDVKGRIGPKTHARIFELLLRLRANTFWPAMHDCSEAFYLTPGNRKMADKYGIYIGTSHCEPMLRNTNAEWKIAGTGVYDFVNNRDNVLKFWEERTRELAGSDNIYTLGIRGVHDSKMLGANTLQEQKDALDQILKAQREMISDIVNPDLEKVSQVFIPYKEVLDVYKTGLQVPEDVTLMWTDDNYGYIRHFPDSAEQTRKGGHGIYNHLSYWGRPHDYLWLATTHPALVYTQMKMAYDKGVRDMWIMNVGDIKPAEYLIELSMDMAWNINAIENNIDGLDKHLQNWLMREFGEKNATDLLAVMNEYYRLAYIRKPEFMGNTRTEERDPAWKEVKDLPWTETEILERIAQYKTIDEKVQQISKTIPEEKRAVWFQLVEYPVRAAANMNYKHLYAQLARHSKIDWEKSDDAHDKIVKLTEKYNSLADGKWRLMMDARPRRLAVFDRVKRTEAPQALPEVERLFFKWNGADFQSFEGPNPLAHGLGYERKAVSLSPNTTLIYNFEVSQTDSLKITVALAPNHPVNGNTLRYAISLNNEKPQIVDFQTQGRSEEWKENVLTNQALRTTIHAVKQTGMQTLKITALDEGVVVDQIKIKN
jgi:hypothetical protein